MRLRRAAGAVLPEADVAALLLLVMVMRMVWMALMVAVVAAVLSVAGVIVAAALLLVVSLTGSFVCVGAVAAGPAAHSDVIDGEKEAAGFRAAEEPVTSEGPVTVSFTDSRALELHPKQHRTAPSGQRPDVLQLRLSQLILRAHLDPKWSIQRQRNQLL